MHHYTLGWHDQQNKHYEIGEYAEDAFEAVKHEGRMFRIYTNILFLWIQLKKLNEKI